MKILAVCVLGCAMMVLARAAVGSHLVNKSASCDDSWSQFKGHCFHYVPIPMTWAKAEKNCQSMGANLASVHNIQEYKETQRVITSAIHDSKEAWIGGSNAQEESVWLWSDGSIFHYSDWCPGEPNNGRGSQRCLQINHSDKKCWDDVSCDHNRPFVCAKKL